MNIFEKEKALFLQVYNRLPLKIKKGEGCWLINENGEKYLDFFSGLAVNALGYAHPKIVEAVCRQVSLYAHLSNNYIIEPQIELAELLIKYSGMSKVFLTNSGTEAIEAAIKLVRYVKGPNKIIYSLTSSFHGRTYGALSLTTREKYQKGFEPLLQNVDRIKHNSIDDLLNKIDENTAAVFLEFIQGEGGINEANENFIAELFRLREKYKFIIVADAIQDGIGRTGKPFAHQYYYVMPDMIATAKAIGGGLPLGALLVSSDYENVWTIGKHGTTFGGNPVSCVAGIVVLREVFENGLMENVIELGAYFKEQLIKLKNIYQSEIKDVRGLGFMLGVELNYEGNDFVKKMFEKKILTNCANQNVIRILPPLIANKNEIDIYLQAYEETIKELKKN
jgi:predicted acetylornithine/succinylornithine family transaminase